MRISMANRWSFNETDHLHLIPVTCLYEDLESGIRAKVLIECVQAGMGLPARFKLDLWRFDWLEEKPLRDVALSAAKSSALVIISANRASRLSAVVDDWVTAWSLSRERHSSALIVLLPRQRNFQSGRHLLRERLQDAAQQKRANFFCEYFDSPGVRVAVRRKPESVHRKIAMRFQQAPARTCLVIPVAGSRIKPLCRLARRP